MFKVAVSSIFAAEILDALTTLQILNAGGFEQNPLVTVLGNYWVIIKLTLPLLLAFACRSLKRSELNLMQLRFLQGFMVVAIFMIFLPVLNNISVIASANF
jgi:hypothetical protein